MSDTDKKQTPVVKQTVGKETAQKPEIVVYIGPDIPGAKQYTTFNNGLPEALKEKISEQPYFRSFVIPVAGLAQANVELAREGSALNVLFCRASGKNTKKGER